MLNQAKLDLIHCQPLNLQPVRHQGGGGLGSSLVPRGGAEGGARHCAPRAH